MNRDRRGLDVHKATVRRACRERSRQRDPPGRALLESSLEGRDIELSVSPKTSVPRPMISTRTAWIDDNLWRGTDGSNPLPSGGESVSPVPSMATGAKGPAFAGSVSLDETRERDVLATSWLALAAFL